MLAYIDKSDFLQLLEENPSEKVNKLHETIPLVFSMISSKISFF